MKTFNIERSNFTFRVISGGQLFSFGVFILITYQEMKRKCQIKVTSGLWESGQQLIFREHIQKFFHTTGILGSNCSMLKQSVLLKIQE